ncbi:MAG TPA: hypothetical protein VFN10_23350 [Thermoanaerobaculia bacterium]|nr:hypothetical protein [Thermoanaerobaculia bacterium]
MTLDGAIHALYAALCFAPGQSPDWNLLANVLAPNARLVRVNDDGVFEFDPRSFRDDLETMMAAGRLPSFWESEVSREVQQFAGIAHVLSIYEARATRDGAVLFRAVKSMQLFERDGRWWISALLWRREGRDFRIAT